MLLLDPILASGNSAMAAIDLLVSKGVAEDHIIFLTLIAAPQGISNVCERYPRLVVVTSEIDASLSESHVVLPGIGEFGDRYFGTDCTPGAIRPGERASASLTPRGSVGAELDAAADAARGAHAAAAAGEPAESGGGGGGGGGSGGHMRGGGSAGSSTGARRGGGSDTSG